MPGLQPSSAPSDLSLVDLRSKHAHTTDVGRGLATLLRGRASTAGNGAVVLGYHDVTTRAAGNAPYTVTESRLRRHVEWMRHWGFRFVSLDTLVDALFVGAPVDGLAVITFDDGLVGVHEHAAPLLSRLGVPATAFVVTDVRGIVPPFWPEARRAMTTTELLEVEATGIALASHTRTHPSLPDIAPARRDDELAGSRRELEDLTGHLVDHLAYPSGHHDVAVRAAAAGAGYRAAFTFTDGRVRIGEDLLRLPRFSMTDRHHRLRLATHLSRRADAWAGVR
jgi:peptidoglycan/xylan/chitin deacetylase (PgdA/CDA1 family)